MLSLIYQTGSLQKVGSDRPLGLNATNATGTISPAAAFDHQMAIDDASVICLAVCGSTPTCSPAVCQNAAQKRPRTVQIAPPPPRSPSPLPGLYTYCLPQTRPTYNGSVIRPALLQPAMTS